MDRIAIIFGGSGFVGRHLTAYLLDGHHYDRLVVVDLTAPAGNSQQVTYIHTDVREPINDREFRKVIADGDQVHIYNLAALCPVPGFPDRDYFETNIRGAENVCAFADEIGCKTIVFTSTIAVYGASEEGKREDTLPMPDNPYGISKLAAEEVHKTWQATNPEKNLSILRPGIIFGAGEGANFTRLYKAIKGRYFFYPGRKDTRKACIYVKDVAALCCHFAEHRKGLQVFNTVYPESPSISEICSGIASVIHRRAPRLTIPAWLLLAVAQTLRLLSGLFGRKNISLHPDRVRKLMLSTNISGRKLETAGIHLAYPLRQALEDWNRDNGGQGLY